MADNKDLEMADEVENDNPVEDGALLEPPQREASPSPPENVLVPPNHAEVPEAENPNSVADAPPADVAVNAQNEEEDMPLQPIDVNQGMPDNAVALEQNNDNVDEDVVAEILSFRAIYNRIRYEVEMPSSATIKELKEHLAPRINIHQSMQKIVIKGLARDDKTLRELGVTNNCKVMVVGSKLDDVVNVKAQELDPKSEEIAPINTKEPLCKQMIHQKILKKGIPDDATPGIRNCKDSLPQHPLSGMINQHGGKVRLTFKLEADQIWIGTKERTEKINMNSIQSVVNEVIIGHEEYHLMGLQLGPTEASRYWLYWVPAQYTDAIKETILG